MTISAYTLFLLTILAIYEYRRGTRIVQKMYSRYWNELKYVY